MVLSLHKQPFVTAHFQFITAHFVRHCALKNALLGMHNPRSNFRVSLTTRAAAFNTRCNLSVTNSHQRPAKTALQ